MLKRTTLPLEGKVGRRTSLTCLAVSADQVFLSLFISSCLFSAISSQAILALGTNLGGVYFFSIEPFSFIKQANFKTDIDVSITTLQFSYEANDILAVGLSSGVVIVVESKVRSANPEKHKLIKELKDHKHAISQLVWDDQDMQILYSADSGSEECGGVVLRSTPFERFASAEVLINCDSAVVQLQVQNFTLLCSSMTRCLTMDLKVKPRQLLPVGSKV
jgi:hypothetical protein